MDLSLLCHPGNLGPGRKASRTTRAMEKQRPQKPIHVYQALSKCSQHYGLWAARRPRSFYTLIYCVATALLLFNIGFVVLKYPRSLSSSQQSSVTSPANATLGFGAIYAVSRKGSPRRMALERSAELTGLSIKIPSQPVWRDSDIESISAYENSTLDRGSALAWLGHLNALKRFLDSPYETALIVEDDIDYDTHLRTEQIPTTAYAIRDLLNSHGHSEYYYGNPSLWDILWLGHCGDYFDIDQAEQLSEPIKIWTDVTLPLFEGLHPWTRDFLEGLGAYDDQQRLVHRSVRPLCTFAYAVTRSSASKLVYELAVKEPSRPLDRPCSAFDVRLLEACRDEGFSCITVSPELFHHTSAPSEIASVSGNSPVDIDDEDIPDTPNIRCSARSELWWNSRMRPYDFPKLQRRGEVMSRLAQKPGSCYLEEMRPVDEDFD